MTVIQVMVMAHMAICKNSLLCVNKAWEAERHRLSELSVSIQAVE